jgi:hypothetical protein
MNLNDRQIGAAEASHAATESDASGLPPPYRNGQCSRDFRALAASADLEPEGGPVDDPSGRDRETKRDIGKVTLPKEHRADDRKVRQRPEIDRRQPGDGCRRRPDGQTGDKTGKAEAENHHADAADELIDPDNEDHQGMKGGKQERDQHGE